MAYKKIVIDCKFNTMDAVSDRLSYEWIRTRYEIFCRFTLKSLQNQRNQDFLALIKYDEKSRETIWQIAAENETLPSNVVLVSNRGEYEKRLLDYIEGAHVLYLTRIDSDDMYHQDYIEFLHNYVPTPGTLSLINQEGYIYDSVNNRLAHWAHFSPPFYTLIYDAGDYRRGFRYRLTNGHRGAFDLPHEILPPGNFMVLVHGHNTTTNFDRRQRKSIIQDPLEVRRILEEFVGIPVAHHLIREHAGDRISD